MKNTNHSKSLADLKKKNFCIFGSGKSGLAAFQLLKKHKILNCVIFEEKNDYQKTNNLRKNTSDVKQEPIHFVSSFSAGKYDILILSPGIPLTNPLVLEAFEAGCYIISEIELASWFLNPSTKVIAITGTNGKSTVTNFIAHTLTATGHKAITCGNIGKPVCEVLLEKKFDYQFLVIELSSYQLETTYSLHPLVSLFLNLQEDHLGRYESLDTYLKAKWRLLQLTKSKGYNIIDEEVLNQGLRLGLTLPENAKLCLVSEHHQSSHLTTARPSQKDFYKKDGRALPLSLYGAMKDKNPLLFVPINLLDTIEVQFKSLENIHFQITDQKKNLPLDVQNPHLLGKHNAVNYAFCIMALNFLRIPLTAIIKQLQTKTTTYQQLPHRFETISEKNNILIINDSKATNTQSTIVALDCLKTPTHLLLGGKPKGESFKKLIPHLTHVKKIYPFGEASSLIEKDLVHTEKLHNSSRHMQDALEEAFAQIKPGETLLLCPACPSFDEFKNFEERGDVFKGLIKNIFNKKIK